MDDDEVVDAATDEVTVTVVHCWSAPRSRSTALLYSFHSRPDTVGLDEPLYRRWVGETLTAKGKIHRPYRRLLLGKTDDDDDVDDEEGGGVVDALAEEMANDPRWERERMPLAERIDDAVGMPQPGGGGRGGGGGGGVGVVFVKHMAKFHRLYDFAREREVPESSSSSSSSSSPSPPSDATAPPAATRRKKLRHVHVLLLRDPVAVLSSWDASGANHDSSATPDELGFASLLSIHSTLISLAKPVVILDSDNLVSNPAATLRRLCVELGIPYAEEMLTWEAGPKDDCDGPWARWWYGDVHDSTGWVGETTTTPRETPRSYPTLDRGLVDLLRMAMPSYQYLKTLDCTCKNRETRGVVADLGSTTKLYEDERNVDVLVWVGEKGDGDGGGGRLVPRDVAGVSPFDSSVQGGDACWEGLRIYRGNILSLDKHLRRLFRSARALDFRNVHTREEVVEALFRTLAANGMRDGAHVRLTLTRGRKCTSSMNPVFNVYGTTLIVLAEWKPTEGATTYDNARGITLITAANRRNPPSTVDSKIHHNNMINNILPKIQANLAGAADAVMLDLDGFVSETNATNLFMVNDEGTLVTPHADHCLPGITREAVLILAGELGIPTEVRRVSLAEFHAAEEVFTTGTMGELTPVTMIDGRVIGGRCQVGAVTRRLQEVYCTLPERPGWSTPIPPFSRS